MGFLNKIANVVFGPPEQRASQSYAAGMKALERSNVPAAEFHFKAAVDLVPTSSTYRTAYGNMLLMKGQFADAAAQYHAIAEEERSAIVLSNWGVALRLSGQLDEAVIRHEEAAALGHDDIETLRNAAVTFLTAKKTQRAAELLRRALELDPADADAHFMMAQVISPDANETDYLHHLEVASAKDEYKAAALLMKSAHFLTKGLETEAVTLLREALALEAALCTRIEKDEEYAAVRALPAYQEFLKELPRTMWSCATEAESSADMPNGPAGARKHLVVLACARHGAEAEALAAAALNEAGWRNFTLNAVVPAQEEGLNALPPAAREGWQRARQDGAHIFVF